MKYISKALIYSLLFIIVFFQVNTITAKSFNTTPELKGYKYVTIPAGTLIKGILQHEVSTKTNKLNDSVRIITMFDTYMFEAKCIPRNSLFTGNISLFSSAQPGRNGYLRVTINKLTFPNKQTIPVSGYIWSKKENGFIGGDFSPRQLKRKMIHRTKGFDTGVLQLLPGGERVMGKEEILTASKEVIIVLDKDLNLITSSD